MNQIGLEKWPVVAAVVAPTGALNGLIYLFMSHDAHISVWTVVAARLVRASPMWETHVCSQRHSTDGGFRCWIGERSAPDWRDLAIST
ncbi:hypothetical protein ZHAS_00021465 [Anopheles sinensis]|uniref:Uncharacterized protein n=1 Tax=Anopheles sinensis TaxID=74873 RepID=A0A084WSH1_ANOSI|nr:hypothetical protein ZHAS_00021465 [Anopheles sinensis]